MKIVNINVKEFKKTIYKEYLKLFPKEERKTFRRIKKTFKKGILKIFKIVDNDILVGFIITNALKNSKYLQIDYLAIFENYQGNGYGNKAILLLKEISQNYDGIFIEVDKEGLGKDEKENILRTRRIRFYENLNFHKINVDLYLFDVIFTPFVLPITNNNINEELIIEDISNMYIAVFGKKKFNKKIKFMK